MDPFLEDREIFPDLHDAFITYLREQLKFALPAPYYSPINRRAWIEISERYIEPDVNIVRSRRAEASPTGEQRAVAVADDTTVEPVIIHVPHDEHREPFLEVYVGRGDERRLVTHIEVLSPSNKTQGHQGRELYLHKQQEVLRSKVHLVEVDLLRGGTHTTAVPLDRLRQRVPRYDYHVCIHRFDRFEDYIVYPIRLSQRLPKIDIPLLPADGNVSIDFQAVFDRCYDTGPYEFEIDYSGGVPQPSIDDEQRKWLKAQLESKR